MNITRRKTLRVAFLRSLPVMAGYLTLGMGFGILLETKGFCWLWAALMSLTIYAGSMQYVAVSLLATGASLLSAALMTVMINARHVFYGLSMLDKYHDVGRRKPYLIFALTDETYSLVCSDTLPGGVDKRDYFLFVSLLNQLYWVTGSAFGGLLGGAITFNSQGVDFAMTALFVIIFTEQWKSTNQHIPALIGIVVTLLCLLFFGSKNFLIPSMLFISSLLIVFRHRLTPPKETAPSDHLDTKEGSHA